MSDNSLSLTVVVPTLNSAATLHWTLASLKAAGISDVVVVDSFSTDRTLEICRQWNVPTTSFPAGNMYAAINYALGAASTEWLAYVNSDDWIFPKTYIDMLHAASKTSAAVVYGNADYVDESGRFIFSLRAPKPGGAIRILRAGYMPFAQPVAIFRRGVYQQLNGFDEQYRAAADLDFFARAAAGGYEFHRHRSAPVAAFRVHENQLSSRTPELGQGETAEIRSRLKRVSQWDDTFYFHFWRLSNLPAYVQRLLRSYALSERP